MNDTQNTRPDRPDDSGYNNPSKSPAQSRPLSADEIEEFNADDLARNPLLQNADQSADPALSPVQILARTRRFFRTSVSLLLIALCVIGLFFYATALDFIATVSSYPVYLQLPVWLLLALVLFLVLYGIIKLLLLWKSLQQHPQVALSQADVADRAKAGKELAKYLGKLTAKGNRQAQKWSKYWPDDPDKVNDLVQACTQLAGNRHIDADTWLEEFEERIRKPMDQAAANRIRHYWQLVGIKTAISPFPLIDALAVIYNNFLMIGDLAELYGRRISRADVFTLLWAIIFQVYISAQSQEILDSIADEMTKSIESGIARSLTSFLSPKLAEGTVNALVTWRIGKRAMAMMQPVQG
ncbi:MAG: YcjF family protein [Puniceicoccaceae bacterium]